MVNKLFLEQYYRKMLYFYAGVQICIYNMNCYKNLLDTKKVKQYFTDILHKYKFIPICDYNGRCSDFICRYTAKSFENKSDIFLFLDDYYDDEIIDCVYVKSYDITIISLPYGINASEFYYFANRRKESDKYYFDTAMEYFYISCDYCQENNDMV